MIKSTNWTLAPVLLNVLTKGTEHRRTIRPVMLRMQTFIVIECMHTAICSCMTGSLPRSLIVDETHKLPRANSNAVKRKYECCRGRFRRFRPIRMKALPPVKRISSNIYQELSPPQRLLLAMIKISIEIHFTTLYMADLGDGKGRVPRANSNKNVTWLANNKI